MLTIYPVLLFVHIGKILLTLYISIVTFFASQMRWSHTPINMSLVIVFNKSTITFLPLGFEKLIFSLLIFVQIFLLITPKTVSTGASVGLYGGSQFNSTLIICAILLTSSVRCSNGLSKITLRGWLFSRCQQSTNFFKIARKSERSFLYLSDHGSLQSISHCCIIRKSC